MEVELLPAVKAARPVADRCASRKPLLEFQQHFQLLFLKLDPVIGMVDAEPSRAFPLLMKSGRLYWIKRLVAGASPGVQP